MAMISNPHDFFTKGCGRCDRFSTPDCSTRLWIDGLEDLAALFEEGCETAGEMGKLPVGSYPPADTLIAHDRDPVLMFSEPFQQCRKALAHLTYSCNES